MKFDKKSGKTAAIGAIAFITYNLLFFIWFGFEGHSSPFWISWGGMQLAFAAVAITWVKMGNSGMFMRDWLFGYPIFKHGIIYVTATFLLSTVFAVLDDAVSWSVAFVPLFLLFAVYMVFAISGFLAKETIEDINTNVKDKTGFIKLLRADAETMMDKCASPELKEKCRKFAESVRYSDPMSAESLFELEKQLAYAVAECDAAVTAGDYTAAEEALDQAVLLLAERNRKCKALK